MSGAAGGDGGAERHDPLRVRLRPLQVGERPLGDVVQIRVVALDELDDDRFLGLEVVIQAAGQDAAGVRDLLDDVLSPEEANSLAAVSRISVFRAPSTDTRRPLPSVPTCRRDGTER